MANARCVHFAPDRYVVQIKLEQCCEISCSYPSSSIYLQSWGPVTIAYEVSPCWSRYW
jgi:hypothetical protein